MRTSTLKLRAVLWLGALASLWACGDADPTTSWPREVTGMADHQRRKGVEGTPRDDVAAVVAALPNATLKRAGATGVAEIIVGALGKAAPEELKEGATEPLSAIARAFLVDTSELRLFHARQDAQGFHHFRYQQTRDGLDVVNGGIDIHATSDGTIFFAVGHGRGDWESSALPRLDKTTVASKVRATRPQAQLSQQRLVYYLKPDGVALSWELLFDKETFNESRVFVDANTGAVIDSFRTSHAFFQGLAVYDRNHADATYVIRAAEKKKWGPWVGPPAQAATVHQSVHDAWSTVQTVRQTLANVLVKDHYPGSSDFEEIHKGVGCIKAVTRFGVAANHNNAWWHGTAQANFFGTGDKLVETWKNTSIVAHEMGHGALDTRNAIAGGGRGPLHEHVADLYGVIGSERGYCIGQGSWTHTTTCLRDFRNPRAGYGTTSVPDHNYFATGAAHRDNQILNHAFWMMAEGEKHVRNGAAIGTTATIPDTQPIAFGKNATARLWINGYTNFLPATGVQFRDSRSALELQVMMEGYFLTGECGSYGEDWYNACEYDITTVFDVVGIPGVAPAGTLPEWDGDVVAGDCSSAGAATPRLAPVDDAEVPIDDGTECCTTCADPVPDPDPVPFPPPARDTGRADVDTEQPVIGVEIDLSGR